MIELPIAFCERMRNRLGEEGWVAFEKAIEAEPMISIRWNAAKKISAAGFRFPVDWCATAEYLEERPRFVADPLFHAGAYYVQEASSMLIGEMVKGFTPVTVLDLCAAPGGKTTLLASLLPAHGSA